MCHGALVEDGEIDADVKLVAADGSHERLCPAVSKVVPGCRVRAFANAKVSGSQKRCCKHCTNKLALQELNLVSLCAFMHLANGGVATRSERTHHRLLRALALVRTESSPRQTLRAAVVQEKKMMVGASGRAGGCVSADGGSN